MQVPTPLIQPNLKRFSTPTRATQASPPNSAPFLKRFSTHTRATQASPPIRTFSQTLLDPHQGDASVPTHSHLFSNAARPPPWATQASPPFSTPPPPLRDWEAW